MTRFYFLIFLLLGLKLNAQVATPREIYPDLFEAIQMQQVFTDGKTFPDMLPKQNPEEILKAYRLKKQNPDFNLAEFAKTNFELSESKAANYSSNVKDGVKKHIDTLWTVLSRQPELPLSSSSLIALPAPYIVPGGRFREIYYWDSYFTMLGLRYSSKKEMIGHMVDNFAYLIRNYGFIPNGNRTYYLSRSQPPFFAQMVNLLASISGNKVYINYRDALEKEYQFWMLGADTLTVGNATHHTVKMAGGTVLNRYWDESSEPREESYREDVLAAESSAMPKPEFYRNIRAAAESGWDFSSRWFADGENLNTIITTNLLPVDLNGLLYNLEKTIAKAYHEEGNSAKEMFYQQKAESRKKAMLKYFWNKKAHFFTDYNWKEQRSSAQITLAGASPLYFDISKKSQARKTAKRLKQQFLKAGGLITTLNNTKQQWDAPNGWAPLQWMTIEGLNNYHQKKLAETIARKWIDFNVKVFENTGKLMEKYDVTHPNEIAGGGEYPLQDGFGWTNGVLLSLMEKYPKTN